MGNTYLTKTNILIIWLILQFFLIYKLIIQEVFKKKKEGVIEKQALYGVKLIFEFLVHFSSFILKFKFNIQKYRK